MEIHTVNIDFPSDVYLALNLSDSELIQNIKFSLAIRLYSLEKVSIGKAAQIAGLPRFEFETLLSENSIPISKLNFDEVMSDFQKLI